VISQILNEEQPEKIVAGLLCLQNIFEATEKNISKMFKDCKNRILKIASK
jgi:hypothetical protein